MSVIDLLGAAAIVAASIVVVRLLRYPHIGLPSFLSTSDLGRLESELPDLKSVTVIAHQIEDPQDVLRSAVKRNLQRGVQYRFLVSESNANAQLNGYYRIFETLADIVQHECIDETRPAKSLVSIQSLPYDWLEYPYVFYEVPDRERNATRFIAVRGTDKLEGIADYYTRVEPSYAHMIARAVLSDPPRPIPVSREQFEQSNVVPISRHVRQ